MGEITDCSLLLTFIVFATASKKCTINSQLSPAYNNDSITISSGPIPLVDLIRTRGYPAEEHEILTEDGYLLTFHRIPHGKNASFSSSQRRAPVLLQHGMVTCSAVWLMSDNGLGFLLADAGFDVWLGNSRGNTYGRKHVKYDPDKDEEQFWNFSWHEMGTYDLPAAIDYILKNTSRDQLSFIGHSMSTTTYFVLGSTRPEYMQKVNAMVAFAPIAYLWNVRSPIVKLLLLTKSILYWLAEKYEWNGVMENTYNYYWADHIICTNPWLQFICVFFVSEMSGFDKREFDLKAFPLELDYAPAGASFKTFKHYLQIAENGFTQFDYGPCENSRKYGTPTPPTYDLSRVQSPVFVWWTQNDYLAVPQTVKETVKDLPNVKSFKVPYEDFSHLDFIWAIHAKTLVYDDVIATLKNLRQIENND